MGFVSVPKVFNLTKVEILRTSLFWGRVQRKKDSERVDFREEKERLMGPSETGTKILTLYVMSSVIGVHW